ncbi:Replication factor A protein 2 [Elasticomyces elasticus]|uniref:Replication factor A protein 2 n=1 Tax=Elasticomyces elasticus TaxID=574655 RepID=A0AAN7W8L5_9PEZI|nr:Replication factor A protein 2 [Elasticomyces elasticus]
MNDYSNNYSTTSYGAQGGAQGGGFMPGSQTGDSPNAKRSYGKDTLRPVTIKQLLDAHHPHPDAEYFMVDGSEATQVTFVGQVRNISTQTTNVTYKLDDGTGIIEVKVWIDADAFNDEADPSNQKPKPVEQGYARVWGRLKAFNNKRHVGANIIRPIQDFNEIQYHLLEATAVHLHFSRGPVEQLQQSNGGAQSNGAQNGAYGGGMQQVGGGKQLPAGTSMAARKVFQAIKTTEQGNEGLHIQHIATAAGLDINEVVKGGGELMDMGMIFTTVDETPNSPDIRLDLPRNPATMISDASLYSLAVFLGSAAMLLIVFYHFLEINSKDDGKPAVSGERKADAIPQKAR